jgi:hypothetical protein
MGHRILTALFFLLLGLRCAPDLFAQQKQRINGHAVVLDGQGKLLSWVSPQERAYDRVVKLGWDFILNKVPVESNGLRTYLTHSTFDPATLRGTDWPHNPAGLYAMFVDSALAYDAYSGDSIVLDRVREMLDYQLAHGTTPASWDWPSVPYASSDAGALDYFGADDARYCLIDRKVATPCGSGDGHYVIEPDKVAELGLGYLKFYELTGEGKYLDAAIACANALASHARAGDLTHSPWPFRVFAHTNAPREEYAGDTIGPIKLFDELLRLGRGNTAAYARSRKTAWDWMMTFPMRNNLWGAYFEDVSFDPDLENWNQYCALETARYLLLYPETDPEWKVHARGLLAWVEKTFVVDFPATEHYRWVQQEPVQYGRQWGANVVSEQTRDDMNKMGSHTSRYASLCALYYEKTGDEIFKEKAFRSFNWATYMAHEDGLITEAMAEDAFWYSDGYADYIRHFLAGMGAVPEWSPTRENHLLRSSSVVQKVTYGPNEVRYTTFDTDATEVLRLAFSPVRVTADGTALQPRSELSQAGWVFDAAKGVLRVRHPKAREVVISGQ